MKVNSLMKVKEKSTNVRKSNNKMGLWIPSGVSKMQQSDPSADLRSLISLSFKQKFVGILKKMWF